MQERKFCLPSHDMPLSNYAHFNSAAWIALSVLWIAAFFLYQRKVRKVVSARAALFIFGTLSLAATLWGPDFSNDLLRYAWDGRVASVGVSPYAFPPAATALASAAVVSDSISLPADLSYKELPTIYPPGSQLLFEVMWRCTQSVRWFHFGLSALAIAGGLLVLWGFPPHQRGYALAALTCPTILIHGFGYAHTDIFMSLFALAAVLFAQRNALVPSAMSLGMAIATKYLPLVLLPEFLRRKNIRSGLLFSVVCAATVAVLYAPYLGGNVLGSLGVFAATWQSNSALYSLLMNVVAPETARYIMAGMGLAGCATVWYVFRATPWCGTVAAILTLLLCSPVVHPWYLALPITLIPFAPLRSTMVWAATISVYGIAYENYKGNGVWTDHPVALAVEFLPVVVALAIDLRRGPLLLNDEHGARLRTTA